MKSQVKLFAAILGASLLFVDCATAADQSPSRQVHIYNLRRDWSNETNPNGVWSYNQNSAPITQFQTFWWGQPGWGYIQIGDGCIFKARRYPAGITDPWGATLAPAHDWRAGDVILAALSIPYGGDSTFVNVTWTSPTDGTINIRGRVWDAQIFSDRDMSWSLIVGGKTVAQRSSVRGIFRKDEAAQFGANQLEKHSLSNIPVTAGEVVEFRVVTSTYYGHFVGLEEKITLIQKRK